MPGLGEVGMTNDWCINRPTYFQVRLGIGHYGINYVILYTNLYAICEPPKSDTVGKRKLCRISKLSDHSGEVSM